MRRLQNPPGAPTSLDLDGKSLSAFEGEPIACALLAAGEHIFSRSSKYHRPRGPYCFSGSCSHCLMRVNGMPNVMTCRTPVTPHTRVERQNAFPSARLDALNALDWLFPGGMDHHRLFAGVPLAEQTLAVLARQLAGLGHLPESTAPSPGASRILRTRAAVVGAGASGTAAAAVLTRLAIPFVLVDKDAQPKVQFEALLSQTTAVGFYEDADGSFLAAVTENEDRPRVLKIYAERYLFCLGGHPTLLPFENNDLPGIFDGGAVRLLVREHHLIPPGPVVLMGTRFELSKLASELDGSGIDIAAKLELQLHASKELDASAVDPSSVSAHGRTHLTAISFPSRRRGRTRIPCRTLALAVPTGPRFELARQAGGRVSFSPDISRFLVDAGPNGETDAGGIYVAGRLVGCRSVAESEASGQRAARALAESLS